MPAERPVQVRAPDVYRRLGELIGLCLARAEDLRAGGGSSGPADIPAPNVPSAENLLHYLAFRAGDHRDLQKALMSLGLSSLGRSEPAVLHALSMARHAAGRLVDPPLTGAEPDPIGFPVSAGRATLDRETDLLFGPRPEERTPRIMVTLADEAADDPGFAERCIRAGMNAARINSTQHDLGVWRRMIANVRNAEHATGGGCKVFVDLAGPKIRIEGMLDDGEKADRARFHTGEAFRMYRQRPVKSRGKAGGISVWPSHAEVFDALLPGGRVWFDDGKVGAAVERIDDGSALLRVHHAKAGGQKLRVRKGINLPGAKIDLPSLTEQDHETIAALAGEVDAFCLSFARTPGDVRGLLDELRIHNALDTAVVVKVETREGFMNLPSLLLELMHAPSRGVMIARGDLAVEVGFQRLAEVQEEILWLCEAAHTPVIWATEVLTTLTKTGVMTRAEVTDAAMAQRAECVMLNKGPRVLDAVGSLSDILHRMQSHQRKKMAVLRPLQVAGASQGVPV